MTIVRTIDGEEVKIELTCSELWHSYEEEEFLMAKSDLDIWLEDQEIDGSNLTDVMRDAIAWKYIKFRSDDWQDIMESAYNYVIKCNT